MLPMMRPLSRALPALLLLAAAAPAGVRWGEEGHVISGRVAAAKLPAEMPAFFRDAADQLGWLNPEPDRWRADSLVEMNAAFRFDHYIDFEVVPAAALAAADRYAYLRALAQSGLEQPERDAGLLPFRIIELQQRLTTGFRLWREADDATRGWLEQRILNDAGILGHYVADGANPLHTSVHHNGWNAEFPNPNGFTTDRTLHWRFEGVYVRAAVSFGDVLPRVPDEPRALGDARAAVLRYLHDSHDHLVALYRLEADQPFGEATRSTAAHDFVAGRLAVGATMLRDLWWSAWIDSGRPTAPRD